MYFRALCWVFTNTWIINEATFYSLDLSRPLNPIETYYTEARTHSSSANWRQHTCDSVDCDQRWEETAESSSNHISAPGSTGLPLAHVSCAALQRSGKVNSLINACSSKLCWPGSPAASGQRQKAEQRSFIDKPRVADGKTSGRINILSHWCAWRCSQCEGLCPLRY